MHVDEAMLYVSVLLKLTSRRKKVIGIRKPETTSTPATIGRYLQSHPVAGSPRTMPGYSYRLIQPRRRWRCTSAPAVRNGAGYWGNPAIRASRGEAHSPVETLFASLSHVRSLVLIVPVTRRTPIIELLHELRRRAVCKHAGDGNTLLPMFDVE
jgi:hypothetical protein